MTERRPGVVPDRDGIYPLPEVPPALVPLTLVPVEVFGGDCDCHENRSDTTGADDCDGWCYGVCDAVESWSDCNRAVGKIYRVDDPGSNREPGETVTVHVDPAQLGFFEKHWGDNPGGEPLVDQQPRQARPPLTQAEAARKYVRLVRKLTNAAEAWGHLTDAEQDAVDAYLAAP